MIRIPLTDIDIPFQNAHSALVGGLGGAVHLSRTMATDSHWTVLAHNWKKKYNITVVAGEAGPWKYLDFVDGKSYTMFLLKWS